ncbi:hypothetical protein COO59_17820 [Mixta theicola]|uniref:Glycosyl transferase family 25 domain-containing protein n=1 Tax=Mixta theicola TaxID=1458355 RepID=A0A2K1Q5K1_9GAMM|nr:glycosyltransferase family 25 protein [Mixta theicola]PNS10315.1 hypothetical protein COO59_17820 [Mixta theicola]
MKVFVINLDGNYERREKTEKQCDINNIKYEVISAVDGKALPTGLMPLVVHDYPRCALTRGEIGCALSHLSIYARMIAENIPNALVLEDDALISPGLHSHLAGIKTLISVNKPEIFLLTGNCIYNPRVNKTDLYNNEYYRVAYGSGGHGYVVNQSAAREILKVNRPIIFEADRWTLFRLTGALRVWCSKQCVIESSDVNRETSVLEKERKNQFIARSAYINNLKKSLRFYQARRIKDVLLNKTGLVQQ